MQIPHVSNVMKVEVEVQNIYWGEPTEVVIFVK